MTVKRPARHSFPIADSLDQLLYGASERTLMTAGDSKSGARLERIFQLSPLR